MAYHISIPTGGAANNTYHDAVSNVRGASCVGHIVDFVGHFVYVVVLLQVKVGHSRRGEADNSDACLVGADLQSADDVYGELLDDVPLKFVKAGG